MSAARWSSWVPQRKKNAVPVNPTDFCSFALGYTAPKSPLAMDRGREDEPATATITIP